MEEKGNESKSSKIRIEIFLLPHFISQIGAAVGYFDLAHASFVGFVA